MSSKRRHEGEFMTDHRASPGLPDQFMPAGMPPRSGQGLFETPTFTCNHCPRVIIMNPLRTRERAWCRYCDHYICDNCGAILAASRKCLPYRNFLDELQEEGLKIAKQAKEPDNGKEITIS